MFVPDKNTTKYSLVSLVSRVRDSVHKIEENKLTFTYTMFTQHCNRGKQALGYQGHVDISVKFFFAFIDTNYPHRQNAIPRFWIFFQFFVTTRRFDLRLRHTHA